VTLIPESGPFLRETSAGPTWLTWQPPEGAATHQGRSGPEPRTTLKESPERARGVGGWGCLSVGMCDWLLGGRAIMADGGAWGRPGAQFVHSTHRWLDGGLGKASLRLSCEGRRCGLRPVANDYP
jgi:hypothetical protein